MSIQLCGQVTVVAGGRHLEGSLPGRQGVHLFAYLVLHRQRPVARIELVEALWPEEIPGDPDAGLRSILSKIRAAIGREIATGRDPLRVRIPDGSRVDVENAEEAIHRAESAVARRDWTAAWGPSRVALLVAGRGFLPGHTAPWITARRRQLAEIERRALRAVVATGVGIGGGELDIAESAARRLASEAPLEERAQRCLMEVLAARGAIAEALAVYESLRQRLRQDLGVAPGPETRRLHSALLGASSEDP